MQVLGNRKKKHILQAFIFANKTQLNTLQVSIFVIFLFFEKMQKQMAPAALLKKRPWHRCFPVNFAKFLRTHFLKNTTGRAASERISIIHFIFNFMPGTTLFLILKDGFPCWFCLDFRASFTRICLQHLCLLNVEASHLFCSGNQIAGFYMKCNTELKC